MAAGLGYKEFSTGDVLTAADANGYLASQVVMVFASAAARTSAIASPQEGMISYLKDTDATQYYSGSAWVAIAGASSSGLTLINSTSFTASSAVSVNSVFSSTYRNYKIVASYNMSVNNEALNMRLRVSGTDDSSANYYINGTIGVTANISNVGAANQTSFKVQQGGATAAGFSMDLYAPNIGTRINMTSQGSAISTGAYASGFNIGGFLDANVTADGFTLIPGSGTITGIVKVYGYAN
jgi:hypothetical protein